MDYFALISSVLYLAAGLIASIQLFSPSRMLTNWFLIIVSGALLTHATWLYQNIAIAEGVNLPILNVLSLVTFTVSLLSTIASRRLNTGMLLPAVYGFTVFCFSAAVYLPSNYITQLQTHPQFSIHIIFALLAYSILCIASLFALQLAYLDHRLKSRKLPLTKINMPAMMTLEKSLFQFVLIGFILLSCALLTGFVFVDDVFVQGKAHKTILSILAWAIYATLLWGQFFRGWRGRFVAYCTIFSSILLTLAYFGSRFVKEIILS